MKTKKDGTCKYGCHICPSCMETLPELALAKKVINHEIDQRKCLEIQLNDRESLILDHERTINKLESAIKIEKEWSERQESINKHLKEQIK
jgi:hypothetical protein